ncbi:sigma-70 family RNA polymerase sigma factor [Cryptosporangium phraense]|uniref:Sigma-70 family RNA polymerase sigma factor n=1 Tax=Cryptosporangium phraense TaxID=2593070 RepID=A0A545AGG0_9ACTN|nr:sigma-70 family RNA polymerase sigma factor [Cryptosporangium phraense]TQS40409.1 sigma-70 family RNA polymerase sigma factor [Cryptosporangium phraense]
MASMSSGELPATEGEDLARYLFTEHGRALMGYATLLTGDPAIAEDVVQETILQAWRNPAVISNGKGSLRGWLLTVARNLIIDQARAKASRPAEAAEIIHRPPVARDHADWVVDSLAVNEALGRLAPEHRDVLVHVYFDGATLKQTAERLGVPLGTIKSRLYYGQRALRAAFEDREDDRDLAWTQAG